MWSVKEGKEEDQNYLLSYALSHLLPHLILTTVPQVGIISH